ncbi:class I SAM-dependent methyltransferase [Marinirhabdus gelatinilytica]|uniref:2-polyprenyl-3-methyl-5-hydroxy-6-metoxy-1, 4-benzoquinol methylase n=1 Tax=Marinirhabdus gelatinilytica TaxID=1703343 RepID=A0A370QJG6_9FLAO|nr:class I SAM-dependent methyltransferase [Marinirhabdus gelatinilytica]RDK88492.1 2-polyprenyl-3-methyl-5-hydroxy-6-metoxy-1,4-benzoquinol methylase [Marinirhabdus gelatinilytica]
MVSKSVYISIKDHLVSGEEFKLLFDPELEMLITSPQPLEETLHSYYESENYISHTDDKKGVISFLYQTVKEFALKRKVKLVTKLNNGNGKLLDIGAGTGDFLVVAKNRGWEVSGVEVSAKARSLAAEKNLDLKQDIQEVLSQKFDVITLWHVLEHIPNYKEMLQTYHSLLHENGILIIAVPNFKSYDANYYKKHWAAYDVPRHLWHFSRVSIPKILKDTFKLVTMKPMLFDSYYVSLLSEKYKTGNNFSIRAFWVGLVSNLKAMRTKEYSSLIYCFKKHI